MGVVVERERTDPSRSESCASGNPTRANARQRRRRVPRHGGARLNAARAVPRAGGRLYICALTAHATDEDREECLAAGANTAKPVPPPPGPPQRAVGAEEAVGNGPKPLATGPLATAPSLSASAPRPPSPPPLLVIQDLYCPRTGLARPACGLLTPVLLLGAAGGRGGNTGARTRRHLLLLATAHRLETSPIERFEND
jgi:hypothetical protein